MTHYCDECGETLHKSSAEYKRHKNHFCDLKCCGKYFSRTKSKKPIIPCFWCKTLFEIRRKQIGKSKHNFCSRKCLFNFRRTQTGILSPTTLKMGRLERFFWERYKTLKNRSKTDKLPFNLDSKDLYNLYLKQNKKCYYSNIDLNVETHRKSEDPQNYNTLSVDRIVPNKGYTKKNIVLCCYSINRFKSNSKIKDLKEIILGLYNNLDFILEKELKELEDV